MRRTLEVGLVALIGLACVAFAAVLVRGPVRGEERTMRDTWRSWRSWWTGEGEEARDLARDEVLRLPGGGSWIRVQEGSVVVTREGDAEDHVLEAGAELRLPGGGLALAWALEPSRIQVRAGEVRAGERPATPRPLSLAR